MKLNYVLMGSDMNPLYLDFWPVVSKVWREIFNIIPVLGLICDQESEMYYDGNGLVVKLKSVGGIENSTQSQLVRFYLPKYLDGNCIISDIDMLPLSKKYFIDKISEYSEKDFIILSSHHPQTINIKQYPMCYVAGSDKIFKKIFNLQDDWENFLKKIPMDGWYTDQNHLYNIIHKNPKISYKFPERENGFYENRIDRAQWTYDLKKLKEQFYIDSHLLRPYSQYKKQIDDLINFLFLFHNSK